MTTMEPSAFAIPRNILLRKISMFLIIPAAPLLITSGVFEAVSLAIGLVPHTVSLIVGALDIRKHNMQLTEAVLPDIFMAFVYFWCCLPWWISPSGWNDGVLIMQTYASAFLLMEM